MPNIGLSEDTYKQLNKLKDEIIKSSPAANPSYDSIVKWALESLRKGKK